MLLARYLHAKKPPFLPARRCYATREGQTALTFRTEYLAPFHQPTVDLSNFASRKVLRQLGLDVVYFQTSTAEYLPENSRGFLYYRPGINELAGQLRLRICEDASSFDSGHDLLVDGVRPWGLHLIDLLRSSRYQPIVDIVVKDGFISSHIVDTLRARVGDSGKTSTRSWRNILCALSDPFYVRLDQPIQTLRIVSEQHTRQFVFPYTFSTFPFFKPTGNRYPPVSPFTGSLKVRFELSKLPEHASLGPTLVLKILEARNVHQVRKDITIVKEPIAGEYHYLFPRDHRRLWRLRINKTAAARQAFGPLLDMPGVVYAE